MRSIPTHGKTKAAEVALCLGVPEPTRTKPSSGREPYEGEGLPCRMLRVASTRATLRLQPPARHAKGQCSFLPLHRRVEAAAARNDLDECRRLLTHDPRVLPSVESNRP